MARTPVNVSADFDSGRRMRDATVHAYRRSDGAELTFYAAEVGGAPLTFTLTDARGEAVLWFDEADAGAEEILIGITPATGGDERLAPFDLANVTKTELDAAIAAGGGGGGGGADGLSAYEVAVANGFVGTEAEWLASLVGPQGNPGPAGADGANGANGADGASAYEVAVANGFVGTEAQWLASLVGAAGADGADGAQGPPGADGADGASAYEVAVANGFVGTEAEWLASLEGPPGADGANVVTVADADESYVASTIHFTGAEITDQGGGVIDVAIAGGGSISVSDGVTTVDPATQLTLDAGLTVVDNGGGMAVLIPTGRAAARETVDYVTAVIADGAEEVGTLSVISTKTGLGVPGMRLVAIETSAAARVRLYSAPGDQAADAARPFGTDPTGDHGVVFDFLTTPTELAWRFNPIVEAANTDPGLAYADWTIAVMNDSGAGAAITVTLTFVADEGV